MIKTIFLSTWLSWWGDTVFKLRALEEWNGRVREIMVKVVWTLRRREVEQIRFLFKTNGGVIQVEMTRIIIFL